MVEWSALAVAMGIALMAAASIGIFLSVRKMLLRTEIVLDKLEVECTQLSIEAARVLDRASISLDSLQRQLKTGESIMLSMSETAAAVQKTAEAVHSVSERATVSAMEHMERARLENERRIGEVFRWVDAGLTLWHTWNHRSPGSGDGRAE
ncbi:hypothetical protein [Paenibacillus dakarensis]|uniref:hypothetical protein n=1 Tax=Paenibacillus dakarensis TaxID=1527293 RepID=UPI0006D552BE|nr:hypothetical protein [Paenibacillus dakarensis]